MSLKLNVFCDACNKQIDEDERTVCWSCYLDLDNELTEKRKKINELEVVIMEREDEYGVELEACRDLLSKKEK